MFKRIPGSHLYEPSSLTKPWLITLFGIRATDIYKVTGPFVIILCMCICVIYISENIRNCCSSYRRGPSLCFHCHQSANLWSYFRLLSYQMSFPLPLLPTAIALTVSSILDWFVSLHLIAFLSIFVVGSTVFYMVVRNTQFLINVWFSTPMFLIHVSLQKAHIKFPS